MTAQIGDRLLFEGRRFNLSCEPLITWLWRRKNKGLQFRRSHTACRRGYTSRWEIHRGRLYITSISGTLRDGTAATLDSLFVNYSRQYLDSVGANDPANAGPGAYAFWVTGTLRCSFGELLNYFHGGYASTYEGELLLSFKEGFLVGQRIVHNEIIVVAASAAASSRDPAVVLTPLERGSELMHLRDREWRASRSGK
jgi:hypothetical protein